MSGSRRAIGSRGRWRTLSHGAITGITVFLLFVGGGISYAAWSAGANATSTATGATLKISTSGFDSNAFTFRNSALTTTGSVTLTNSTVTTSTSPGNFKMSLGYTGDAALASGLNVSIWSTTNIATCTPGAVIPTGAKTGLWSTVATTMSPIEGSLIKGTSASYCIRVSASSRESISATTTNGGRSIQPSISASLSVGNWSQSASATTTQKTEWIFPAFSAIPNTWYQIVNQGTSNCVDVYAAQDTSGVGAIDYACKAGNATGDYNQQWKFTKTSGAYYTVTPRHAQALRLDVAGASPSSLAAVNLQTSSGSRVSQEWQLQNVVGNLYQLVNRNSGMCLQAYNTSVYNPEIEYAQVTCDGSVGQRFALVVKQVDVPAVTLSCAAANGGGVTYSWTGAAIDLYKFEAKPTAASTWTGIGDAPQGATSITILPAAVAGADGQFNVRAMWLTNQLATSDLWKVTTGGMSVLSCTAPVPLLNAVTCSPSPNNSVAISWGHAAPSAYTIQLLSNGNWIDWGTAAAGSTSFTVAGGDYWYTGVRDLRVVSGPQSVQFQVYNSNGSQNSSTLWCWPTQPVTSVTCTNQKDGDFLTLSWPRTSAGTSLVRMTIPGISSFTRNVTYSGSTASVEFLDDDVRYATAGNSIPATFQLEADGAVVGLLPDRNVRITGTGTGQNSKNLFCQ